MRWRLAMAAAIAPGLALAGWWHRGPSMAAGVARAIGVPGGNGTPDAAATFKAAGVRKCVGAHRTSYIDRPCPAGTREAAASGGTVAVAAFPKPSPTPSSLASSVLGRPLVEPLDPDERDRLRDRAIDDAANRR